MNVRLKHVEALDYLRGIAILAVLSFHTLGDVYGFDLLPWKDWHRSFSVPTSFLYFLPISIGMIGVPIFFVISGFCIHLSFQQQGRKWVGFFIRRLFRIYPAYLAALIFFAILYRYHYQLDWLGWEFGKQLMAHILLIHNYPSGTIGSINGSFWTLAVEFQLYLLYPVLLFLAGRIGWHRIMIILGVIEIAIRGMEGLVETFGAENSTGGRIAWLLTISPVGYWFSWSIGAYIAEAHLINKPLPFFRSRLILWASLAVLCYFIKPLFEFRFLLFALLTAAAVSKLVTSGRLEGKSKSGLLNFIRLSGLWSYSIYLLHQPLLVIYYRAANWLMPDNTRTAPMIFVFMVGTWCVIIPFSILWHNFFEIPGIIVGKRIISSWNGRREHAFGPGFFGGSHQFKMTNWSFRLKFFGVMMFSAASLAGGLALVAPDPASSNNLAWRLATNPDPKKRDGPRAVRLAEEACQQTHYQETVIVGTLAAAYAEAGRFTEAEWTAQ